MPDTPPVQNPTQPTPTPQPTNTLPTTQAPPTIPKNKTPWLLISLVVFLFSATGVLGYKYYEVKQQLDKQQSTPLPSPQLVVSSPSPVISPTSEVDPTASWKTYTNKEYKLSFEYPSNWKLNCTASQDNTWLSRNMCDITAPDTVIDHGYISSGAYFVIGIDKPNPNYSNLEEYLNHAVSQNGYTSESETINNIQGYYLIQNKIKTNFIFEQNGHIIGASWLTSSNDFKTSTNQILSTFQFID